MISMEMSVNGVMTGMAKDTRPIRVLILLPKKLPIKKYFVGEPTQISLNVAALHIDIKWNPTPGIPGLVFGLC